VPPGHRRHPTTGKANGAQHLRAVFVSPQGPDQIVAGISSRGGQDRSSVGMPKSAENSQVPRSAEGPA
jgi:hypothetical protein